MESRNILVVESINDQYFIDAFKNFLNNIDLKIDLPICSIDSYECLNGLSLSSLERKLKELVITIEKQGIEKVGILLDADAEGVDKKIKLIKQAFTNIDYPIEILKPNEWYSHDSLDIKVSCHILNVEGHGELETLLKVIKSSDSVHADCLESWKECLKKKGVLISQKNFEKFWLSIYQRYDCCTSKERSDANKKCGNKASMYKDIWNFSHGALDELVSFMQLFKQT